METGNANRERDHEIAHDLTVLEHRLAAWQPAGRALDRDRMLYDAGRAAAEAESSLRSWRLATAALVLVVIGLGGLLVYERSLLAQERFLLARERSQRSALETALAARTSASEPLPPAPPPRVETSEIEPLPPTSYFALASRLARSAGDLSSLDVESDPELHRPALDPSATDLYPVRLWPRDLRCSEGL
jgi:hypothetical protein